MKIIYIFYLLQNHIYLLEKNTYIYTSLINKNIIEKTQIYNKKNNIADAIAYISGFLLTISITYFISKKWLFPKPKIPQNHHANLKFIVEDNLWEYQYQTYLYYIIGGILAVLLIVFFIYKLNTPQEQNSFFANHIIIKLFIFFLISFYLIKFYYFQGEFMTMILFSFFLIFFYTMLLTSFNIKDNNLQKLDMIYMPVKIVGGLINLITSPLVNDINNEYLDITSSDIFHFIVNYFICYLFYVLLMINFYTGAFIFIFKIIDILIEEYYHSYKEFKMFIYLCTMIIMFLLFII